jgi:maleate isomerase
MIVDKKIFGSGVNTNVDSFDQTMHDLAMTRPDPRPVRLGVLTPSSNVALEPLTSAIAATLPGCSAHFARFRVTEIALTQQALGQFDDSKILAAAELLADARVDAIGWSGTAAGWMGFERDEALCRRIHEHTGIRATTAVLALNELLQRHGVTRLGLVTPYTADVQQRIVAQYARHGITVVAERHLGISVNFDFACVEPAQLDALMREVAAEGAQAVVTYCTNLRAAQLAERFEADTGALLLDTVSTTVWGLLRLLGRDTAALRGWGRLFGG